MTWELEWMMEFFKKRNLLVTQRSSFLALAGIAVSVLVAGCSTTPTVQEAALWDDASQPQSAEQKWEQIDTLSRIELAKIAGSTYVARPRLVNDTGRRAPYFSTVTDHEDSFVERSNEKVAKTRNLRFANYEANRFRSINEEVPPGFEQIQIGYRHIASGMICPFGLSTEDDSFSLSITQIRLFNQQGTDVGCDFRTSTGGLITVFSSYWPDITQEQHAAAADQQIRTQFNTAKALDVGIVSVEDYNPATMGTATASGYDISEAGAERQLKSSYWIVKTRQWHVKVRATHFLDDPLTELFAAIFHSRTHVDVYNAAGRVVGEIDV
ncbi:MAG: hypothetical protein AAGL18_03685 [Pseudomonadota bacterium]